MSGLVFACGLHLTDLVKTQIVTYFSMLHPIIIYFALSFYVSSGKKSSSEKKQK